MGRRTLLGERRTVGQVSEHDCELTQGTSIHSKKMRTQRQVTSKLSKLVSYFFLTLIFHCTICIKLFNIIGQFTCKFNVVCTGKKKKQDKKPFSQFDGSNADFMIGRSNHEAQAGSRTNMTDRGISSNKMISPAQVNNPQVDMHTLEGNIVS